MVLVKPITGGLQKLKNIQSASDFGLADSNGVITLQDDTGYRILGTIDLQGARLELGRDCAIFGVNANSSMLTSTGLSASTALITGSVGCAIYDIGFMNNLVFDLNGDNTTGLDWRYINFVNCEVGTIANYTNFIAFTFGFFSSYNLVFDGSINTIGFTDTIFIPSTGNTMIDIPATASIGRRFRIDKSSFIVPATSTGISISPTSFLSDESFILDTINFSGSGTYLDGVDSTSNRALFTGCRGISNSANLGAYYMEDNATATNITTLGSYVKIAGVTTEGDFVAKFDCATTDNRAEYTGVLDGAYSVLVVGTITGATNAQYGVKVGLNGTPIGVASKVTTNSGGRAENIVAQDVIGNLTAGDFIEVFIAGIDTTSNPTIVDLNVIIRRENE